jgi:hypothetical protein
LCLPYLVQKNLKEVVVLCLEDRTGVAPVYFFYVNFCARLRACLFGRCKIIFRARCISTCVYREWKGEK